MAQCAQPAEARANEAAVRADKAERALQRDADARAAAERALADGARRRWHGNAHCGG